MMKRRSLVFVVSDFISQPGWEDALGRLTQRHEVIAVRLWDPMEMALPDVGLVTIEDAETGEVQKLNFDQEAQAEYTANFDAYARGIREVAQRKGGKYAGVVTSTRPGRPPPPVAPRVSHESAPR
jgi:hypothetical protein